MVLILVICQMCAMFKTTKICIDEIFKGSYVEKQRLKSEN